MPRGEMYVRVLPEHLGNGAAEEDRITRALELAVIAAVGDPEAMCAVGEEHVILRQGRQTWHAETPGEAADMLADDRDPADAIEAVRDAAGMGLCDFRLEWHEGLPPGTEG